MALHGLILLGMVHACVCVNNRLFTHGTILARHGLKIDEKNLLTEWRNLIDLSA
jgi:hypothetical protein